MSDFYEQVKDVVIAMQAVRNDLISEGPAIIERASTHYGSLRKAAKAVGLSPTYLSMVGMGVTVISPDAYVRIHDSMLGGPSHD